MSEFGEYIKSVRLSLNLSLRDIEEKSGVSNAYLSMIESGRRPAPHPNILKKLASALGQDLSTLMKMAGFLETGGNEKRTLETEALFNEAKTDPAFAFGHRLRGDLDPETKEFIARMYAKLKSQRGTGK